MTVLHSSINDIDPAQWELLVQHSPTASFFQTRACYDFYASLSFLRPFVFGISENEKLVGVICGYSISDGGALKRFFSRRAIVPGGLLLNIAISQTSITLLLKHVAQVLSKKAIYIEIRNYNDYSCYRTPIEFAGFKYSPHLNFRVKISNLDEAFQKLNSSKRRQIKMTLKAGVRIEEAKTPQDINEFYELLRELYSTKIKLPLFPLNFFQQLNELSNAKILVIKNNEEVIGGIACVFLDKRVVYEWFVCGKDGTEKNLYPSVLATWAGIEYAARNGFEYFDFMGAGKPDESYGVREFKSKFGGELVSYGRFLYVYKPLVYKLAKCYFNVLKKLARI